MTEFNLDDIQYDENHATQQRIAQLNHKKQVLISRLAFPAFVQTGVAGYTVGKHFGGAGAGILGALAGYMLTRNNKMEPIDREIMMKKIKAIDSEIASLQRKNVSQQHANTGIMSADELTEFDYPKYEFYGKYGKFFGQPSTNAHYMIYGLPKGGKSTFALHFAKYLADNFGNVLYVASEEGFSATLQQKVRTFGLKSRNLHFSNFREAEPIMELADSGEFDFLFIDSVNYIKITPEQIEEIKARNPDLSVITIQQATKDGNYKGDTAYAHNCDIVVVVDKGVATQRGRFNDEAAIEVFPPRDKEDGVIGYTDESEELDSLEDGEISDWGEEDF
jgi:predicted ATP-dependent serine protease